MSEPVTQALDQFLRATAVVDSINASLPEGIPGLQPLPKDYVIKTLDKNTAGAMLSATIEGLGGIPGILAWAAMDPKNQSKIYEWMVKLAPTESKVEHSGGISLISALDASPLDDVELGEDGFVK